VDRASITELLLLPTDEARLDNKLINTPFFASICGHREIELYVEISGSSCKSENGLDGEVIVGNPVTAKAILMSITVGQYLIVPECFAHEKRDFLIAALHGGSKLSFELLQELVGVRARLEVVGGRSKSTADVDIILSVASLGHKEPNDVTSRMLHGRR
jgi:hypothetical protein